jgi:hypothetical protein
LAHTPKSGHEVIEGEGFLNIRCGGCVLSKDTFIRESFITGRKEVYHAACDSNASQNSGGIKIHAGIEFHLAPSCGGFIHY